MVQCLFQSMTPLTKKQIADILYCENDKIDVLIQPLVPQTNAVDCGVYAIVYAMNLCLGVHPFFWWKNYSHFHLQGCSIPGHPTKLEIRIFCRCRRPYEANQIMAECSRFDDIPEEVFKS